MVLLGQRGLLKDIERNLKFSDWCGGLPFQWNNTLNQLEMKSKNKLIIFSLRLWTGLFYLIAALIQVGSAFKNSTLMVVTHSIMFLACGVFNLSSHFVNYKQLSGVVQLCNSFITFEENFTRQNRNKVVQNSRGKTQASQLFMRSMIYYMTCTGIIMPITYHLDILRNPCLPMYVGYWMSSQCQDDKPGYYLKATWTSLEIGTKVGISLVSYINWSFLLIGCLYQVALEYIMEEDCFRVYIKEFGKKLMGTHKDDTRGLKKLTLFRRQLQIMSIQYRLNHSQYQIGCAIPSMIALQTISLYNTISLMSGKDTGASIWYNFLYGWVGVVCFFLIMYVFGILADVYNVSSEVQTQINGNGNLKRNKWFKRWIRSCPPLRIYFGGSNFLDRLTPLNFQDFVINQTNHFFSLHENLDKLG